MNKILRKIVVYIGLLVSLLVLIMNLFKISESNAINEYIYIRNENIFLILLTIVLGSLLIFGINRLSKKLDEKDKKIRIGIVTVLIVIYAILSVAWIRWMNVVPVDDSKYIFDIAKLLSDNNFKELKDQYYLGIYHQQIGISVILSTLLKIFSTKDCFCIKIVNLVCNLVTIITMFAILQKFFKEYKVSKGVYWLLSLTFMPLMFLNSFVYGDYIGMGFTTLGIFFIMQYHEKENLFYAIISAICIAISMIAKQNYLITFLAILAYLIIMFFSKKTKRGKFFKFIGFILFAVIAFTPQKMLTQYMIDKLSINEKDAFVTTSYFAMGCSEGPRANGWYNDDLMKYSYENRGNQDKLNKHYKELLSKRVEELRKNPKEAFSFYTNKIASMWAEPTFQSIWYNFPLNLERDGSSSAQASIDNDKAKKFVYQGAGYKIIERYQKMLVIIIFSASVIFCFLERRNLNQNASLFIIIFLGGFFFHLIWEGKSRYVMPYVIYMIPIATLGISLLINRINEKREYEKNQERLEKWL